MIFKVAEVVAPPCVANDKVLVAKVVPDSTLTRAVVPAVLLLANANVAGLGLFMKLPLAPLLKVTVAVPPLVPHVLDPPVPEAEEPVPSTLNMPDCRCRC